MLIVQKYGGTSLGDSSRLQSAAHRIAGLAHQGAQVVVVVSAQGDMTDTMIEKAVQINRRGSNREMDAYLAAGEQMSAGLMAMAIGALGIPAVALSVPYPNYENATDHLDMVWDYFTENKLMEKHTLYNVNIPLNPKGICITRQGGPYYTDDFDPREGNLYMPVGRCIHENKGDLTVDTDCVVSGYISITPMTLTRTDMAVFNLLTKE